MKNVLMVAAIAGLAGVASADVYGDNSGSHLDGGDLHSFFYDQGFNHLDITQVEVTNDASFIYFDISVAADLDATNWGKYLVAMDTGRNAGENSNPWGRVVDFGRGITDFVGSWADDGGSGAGGEFHQFDGAAWNLTDATYTTNTQINASDAGHAAGVQRIAISLAALGLSVGDSVEFDVISTGGGTDPGVDHLSRSDYSTDDWGNGSMSGQFLSYTVVPAPSAIAMVGLGGLMAGRRRR